MAREHARILCRIWRDVDWRALTIDEQWMFETLLSQPTISNAGVIAYTPRSWSKLAVDMTEARVEAALVSLAAKRYVVLDEDTDELLVRTFMRNDGVSANGKVFKNALKVASQVQSDTLRRVLADELRKVGTDGARAAADELDPGGSGLSLVPPVDEASTEVPEGRSGTSHQEPIADEKKSERPQKSCGVGEGVGEVVQLPIVVGSVSSNRRRSDAAATTKAMDEAFDAFWEVYPRREAKQGAKGKFRQAVKAGTSADTIIAGARRYAVYVAQVGRDREKIKIPTTWLNQGCWDDELDGLSAIQTPDRGGDPREWLKERWRAADAAAIALLLGTRYERPDLPVGINGKEAIATFWQTSARKWIEDHHAEALAKLTEERAA